MTAVTNLPLIIHSLNFNSKPYQDFKIERPYLDERWLLEWQKNLGVLRTRFSNEYFDTN
jgi:hypothetical protein